MMHRTDLRVRWFERWHPSLDEALRALPEMETCPHDLFRMLAESPARTRKRIALVTEAGQPVAVAGLLRRGWYWQSIVDGVTSVRSTMPVRPGYLFPALEALRVDIWTGGYEGPPAKHRAIRRAFPLPTFRIDCGANFEKYWKESRNLKTVKNARARTRGYTLEVNGAGAAEWVIRNWDLKWRGHPAGETIAAEDQLLAARYFQERGRLHTLRLLDGGTPVAGHTLFVHRNTVIFTCTYREPAYEYQGVGTRLTDLAFEWAAASGFSKIDVGAGHQYKQRWAPPDGERWYCNVCPPQLYLSKQLVRRGRELVRESLTLLRGGRQTVGQPAGENSGAVAG